MFESKKIQPNNDISINIYNQLKDKIGDINNTLSQLTTNIYKDDEIGEIINKLNDLKITITNNKNGYNTVRANSDVTFVKEQINTEGLTVIMNEFINRHEQKLKDIQRLDKTLINNTDIYNIIKQLEKKMVEYNESYNNFNDIYTKLEGYINLMESIFHNISIPTDTTCEIPSQDIIVNVPKISNDDNLNNDNELNIALDITKEVSDDKIEELLGSILKVKEDVQTQIQSSKKEQPIITKSITTKPITSNPIIKGGSLNITKTTDTINNTILKYHDEWIIALNNYHDYLEIKLYNKQIINPLQDLLKELLNENTPKSLPDLLQDLLQDLLNENITNQVTTLLDKESKNKLQQVIKDNLIILQENKKLDNNYGFNILDIIINQNIFNSIIKEIIESLHPNFTTEISPDDIENILNKKITFDNNKNNLIKILEELKNINFNNNIEFFIINFNTYTIPQEEKTIIIKIICLYYILQDKKIIKFIKIYNKINNFINIYKTNKTNKYFFMGGALDTLISEEDINKSTLSNESNTATLPELITMLHNYENSIHNIKKLSRSLNKRVKLYNIRYIQFINFQKYIVNYATFVIPQGGYSKYQYMSKGNISFFDSLLTKLVITLDKFNNYPKEGNINLQDPTIQWLYSNHYFIIKILQKFFNLLFEFWEKKDSMEKTLPDNRKSWGLDKSIKTNVDNNTNSIWFYLFNSFQEKLFEYYNTQIPPVAAYIKINLMPLEDNHIETFNKQLNNKNLLNSSNLNNCVNASQKIKDEVSKSHFEEIFDPDKFKQNDGIPYYMGLTDFINRGKSIMVLTYGYSGVGKSYTLFGQAAKNENNVKENAIEGMLQSTLKRLGSGIEIKVKIFELYGLGVPYKFYWDKSENFSHCIYDYKIEAGHTGNVSYSKKLPVDFTTYLNITEGYTKIEQEDIDNFTTVITNIDEIRKKYGRIKPTLNNPESSRSIMIYDFNIKLKESIEGKTHVHFVIMDLPGKEDIYQTYCENEDPNYEIDDIYKQYKTVQFPPPKKVTIPKTTNLEYDNKLLKKMMYTNQLWLSMIPEIAEHFELDGLKISSLFNKIEISEEIINKLTVYRQLATGINNDTNIINAPINSNDIRTKYNIRIKEECKNLGIKDPRIQANKKREEVKREEAKLEEAKLEEAKLEEAKQNKTKQNNTNKKQTNTRIPSTSNVNTPINKPDTVIKDNKPDTVIKDNNKDSNIEDNNKDSNIEDNNKDSNIEGFDKYVNNNTNFKITSPLTLNIEKNPHILSIFSKTPPIMHKQYKHYAKNSTLDTITDGQFVHLRLLGLFERALHNIVYMVKTNLEELGAKLNSMLKIKTNTEKRYGYAGLEGMYINENILGLLQVLANKVQISNNREPINIVCEQTEIYKDKNGDSRILPLWEVGDLNNPRLLKDDEFFSHIHYLNEYQKNKIIPKYTIPFEEAKSKTNVNEHIQLNNLYNNSFRDNEYSKTVNENELSSYDYNKIFNIKDPPIKKILDPYLDSIENYFLFFVVSNNKKKDPKTKLHNIETCDKQLQLLYDTRYFMKILAGDKDINIQCDAK